MVQNTLIMILHINYDNYCEFKVSMKCNKA